MRIGIIDTTRRGDWIAELCSEFHQGPVQRCLWTEFRNMCAQSEIPFDHVMLHDGDIRGGPTAGVLPWVSQQLPKSFSGRVWVYSAGGGMRDAGIEGGNVIGIRYPVSRDRCAPNDRIYQLLEYFKEVYATEAVSVAMALQPLCILCMGYLAGLGEDRDRANEISDKLLACGREGEAMIRNLQECKESMSNLVEWFRPALEAISDAAEASGGEEKFWRRISQEFPQGHIGMTAARELLERIKRDNDVQPDLILKAWEYLKGGFL